MNHANSNRNKSVSESVSFDQRQIREDNRKRALSMTILCHSILTQSVISILTWLLLPFLFEYVLIGWSWLVAVSKKTTIFLIQAKADDDVSLFLSFVIRTTAANETNRQQKKS